MKVAQLAVLGLAVVAAGGAFIVAGKLGSTPEPVPQPQVAQQPQIELEEVLVASRDISLGTSLNDSMVEWRKWPKEGVVEGYTVRSRLPEGLDLNENPAITRAPFFNGEPIRESKLVRSDKGYMSAILPAGQQAIATTISTATSAGGFILPNDHVDLIMNRRGDDDKIITETVLENVKVLAIDQTVEEQDGQSVVVGETATLQLTPKQAKILTVAQQMADRLSLALRSLKDSGDQETKSADYLLDGSEGNGRLKIIKYGKAKEVVANSTKSVE